MVDAARAPQRALCPALPQVLGWPEAPRVGGRVEAMGKETGWRPWGAGHSAGGAGRGGWARSPQGEDGGRPGTAAAPVGTVARRGAPFCAGGSPLLCRGLPFCQLGLAFSEAQEPEVSMEMAGAAGPGPSADPPRLRAEPTLAGRPPPSSLPRLPMGGKASPCRASCSLGSPWSPRSQAHPEPRPRARNRPLGDQALAGRVQPRARTPREGRAHPRSHSGPRASWGGSQAASWYSRRPEAPLCLCN